METSSIRNKNRRHGMSGTTLKQLLDTHGDKLSDKDYDKLNATIPKHCCYGYKFLGL